MTDWYENRHKLEPDMVFRHIDGSFVKLDRSVPGDASQWYVADWVGGSWGFWDNTIEPSDLDQLVDDDSRFV